MDRLCPRAAHHVALAWLACSLLTPALAHAQDSPGRHVYVVAHGDTLSRVAARLRVPTSSIILRNRLTPPYALRIGRRLRLPAEVPAEVYRTLPARDAAIAARTPHAHGHGDDEAGEAPERPGWVTFVRHRDDAEITLNLREPMATLHARLERYFRFRDGSRHVIHPRLVHDLAALSDHFGGRNVVLLSAFRPQLTHSTGPRTRHSQGFAVDIRIEGVALRSLYAFCQTLENVGCGLYPRANFVHIDVRREADAWTDEAAPGTRRADAIAEGSDESVAEVMADARSSDQGR